jgi:protein SCO1
MRPRLRIALLAVATVLVLAFALTVLIALPANRSPVGGSAGGAPAAGPFAGESSGEDATGAPSATGFDGAALPANLPAHYFTLEDVFSGRPVSLERYRGQVVVLAFPYSTCASTCTLLAQQIRGALDELPHPVPVVFVSANPRADSPARVARFLAQVSLTGRVEYLTGSVSQLRPVWRAYGVAPASAGQGAYARYVSVFLLGRSGRERVLFGLEQLTPEGLAHDICKLAGCLAP